MCKVAKIFNCLQQGLESQLEEIVKSIPVINGTSVNEDELLFEQAKAVSIHYNICAFVQAE